MQNPIKEDVFLKSSISDLQNLARDMQSPGNEYAIITNAALLEKCLQTLGLTFNSTPLDVQYHYFLLQQKLPLNDSLYQVVKIAHEQLIRMFFDFENYQEEVIALTYMDFEKVQEIELEDKVEKYQFMKSKDRLVNQVIDFLQKQRTQYVLRSQIASPPTIQYLLGLPADISFDVIKKHYTDYLENNSPNKLIALKKLNKISSKDLKNKMFEIQKVKEAYARYLKERA